MLTWSTPVTSSNDLYSPRDISNRNLQESSISIPPWISGSAITGSAVADANSSNSL